MKILLITNDFPPMGGGISNYLKGLYDGFKALDHECTVLFIPINFNCEKINDDVIVEQAHGKWTFNRVSSCKKALKKHKTTEKIHLRGRNGQFLRGGL